MDSFLLCAIIRIITIHKHEVGVFLWWEWEAEFLLELISGADMSREEPSATPHVPA